MKKHRVLLFIILIFNATGGLFAQSADTMYVVRRHVVRDTVYVRDTVRVQDTIIIADYIHSEEFIQDRFVCLAGLELALCVLRKGYRFLFFHKKDYLLTNVIEIPEKYKNSLPCRESNFYEKVFVLFGTKTRI